MAALLLSCRTYPGLCRCVIWRTTVFRAGNSVPKVSFGLKNLPRLALASLGLGTSSLANSQKSAAVTEAKLTHCPKRGSRSLFGGLFWRIRFVVHLGIRAVVLLLRFGPLLLLYPMCFVSSGLASVWYEVLLRSTVAAGPTFIKLGQWFSTRRDLFSVEFCEKFSRLHPRVTPHPWAYTRYSLRRAFGGDWKNIFHIQSKEPIGSGCITQVYRASTDPKNINNSEFQKLVESFEKEDQFEAWKIYRLQGMFHYMFPHKQDPHNEPATVEGLSGGPELEDGRAAPHPDSTTEQHLIPVAIKVMHPGVTHQVRMDLKLMKAASWVLSLLPGLRWLRLTEVMEEFEEVMLRQIDLRNEAKIMERFRENFLGMESVRFPIPLRPFVTRTVVVETYQESTPISTYLTEDVPDVLKQRLARMGLEMLLKMVFVDNFVHGQLCPENILIQGADQFSHQKDNRTTIVDLCDTLIVNVHPSQCPLKLILLDTGIVTQLQPSNFHNLKAVFTAVINGQLHVAGLLSKILEALIVHKVKVDSSFASVIFAIMALDGLSRSLDPELDLLQVVRPMLLKDSAGL
ncbi:putative aarF domain-containing protein kinase 2 isoform X2 [Rhinoraja longicauda]